MKDEIEKLKENLIKKGTKEHCHSVNREEFSRMTVKGWGISGCGGGTIEVTCSYVTGIVAERQLAQELRSKYENR